jgi:hypothetical protein
MNTIDPLAVKLALAPLVVFLVIIGCFIYFKNRKP